MVMYLHVRHVTYSQPCDVVVVAIARRLCTPSMIINYMTEAVVVHARALDFW